ncbi:hypothetical protein HWC35_gp176 [Vibrio phage USC-1]|uniref:Uncharacterized protein n=2 Tax=Aphroditevirus USC1 TaxID=2846605 RepID=A0A514A2R8_9CAUD|nr:hypothetical protein HWC35_gp176 [Vibrio phage USC-1]QCW23158.1 hypothetical protein [Vibrio phage 5 TSL-2019]QDH47570.1 hypothetical protein [Vibrio phage USC-1]
MQTEPKMFELEKIYYQRNEKSILEHCDVSCREIIQSLNRCRYLGTMSCCEGHESNNNVVYYIQMVYSLEAFEKLLKLYQLLTITFDEPNVVEMKFARKRSLANNNDPLNVVTFFVRRDIYTKPSANKVSQIFMSWIEAYRADEPAHFYSWS